MKFLHIISILFIFTCIISCRYNLPVVKIRVDKKIEFDSLTKSVEKTYRYKYFRISRYGIIGTGWKHISCDSSGIKRKILIHKRSSMVCDGYATSLSKEKIFDRHGKRILKKITLEKEEPWRVGKSKEKIIECDSSGNKIITRNRSAKKKLILNSHHHEQKKF